MKKILLTIFVFLIVVLINIFLSNSFAETITYNNKVYDVPDYSDLIKDEYDYTIYFYPSRFYFVQYPKGYHLCFNHGNSDYLCLLDSNFNIVPFNDRYVKGYYRCYLGDSSFQKTTLGTGNSAAMGSNYEIIINSSSEIYQSNYSNSDISVGFKITNYNSIYSTKPNFEITLSNTENTKPPITAYSNYFALEEFEKYRCYISEDGTNWNSMYYDTFNDTINNVTKFRFYYHITKNGAYYFKLVDKETGDEQFITHNIFNILYDETNTFSANGIPIPFCTYERVNGQFIIKTQTFSEKDFLKYKCFYIDEKDYPNNKDYSTWQQMGIGTVNNVQLNQTEYYFFFTVPADSEDTAFFMVFYDNELQEYGDPSTFNCFFDEMNNYSDKVARHYK